MEAGMFVQSTRLSWFVATSLVASPLMAEEPPASASESVPSLEEQFRDPPNSARPRVWWHWMNGNVTKDGIAKDLAWMKRVGIGGLQNFDVNITTPQIVENRLVYMTPEWKDAFRFAASEADRHGLELAIASSPGWSETGGPWVPMSDALKKVVWSETEIAGGERFSVKLPRPPANAGPFGTLHPDEQIAAALNAGDIPPPPPPFYQDIAVFAVPEQQAEAQVVPTYTDGEGTSFDGSALTDADLESAIELPRPVGAAPALHLTFPKPKTVRSATMFMPGAGNPFFGSAFAPQLEASGNGKNWRPVAEIPLAVAPTTVAFKAVTAPHFRIVFNPPVDAGLELSPPAPGVDVSGPGADIANMAAPKPVKIADLRLSSRDRIDRAEAKAGFSIVADYHALSQHVPDTSGVAVSDVIDLTDRLRPNGTLDWTPPSGRWRVLRMGYSLLGTMNHPAPREATGLEVDKYDGSAVRRYLEHYIGMYKDAAGPGLVGERGVRAILNDSIEVGAANWTPMMIDQFKRLRGYDPTPWLPTLTGLIIGSRNQSDQFLYDYRRTLADLLASEHYGTVAEVAHEHGLKVYGEALESGRPSLGDDMAMRRHSDVPMSAIWTYPRASGPIPVYLADMKGAASVAHVYGQNLVAAESMTSLLAPWAFGPADLKRIIDLEFVTGINRPVVHTSVHVPVEDKQPGLSLSVFGQYFNRNEAWAELAKPWVDYISRNSLMLQQGRNVADIAYFYGEEAPLVSLFLREPVSDAPKTVAYDFINADALSDALENDGNDLVTSGGARYRALYLGGSSHQMTLPTIRRLSALVEGGATLIGQRPAGNPSLADDPAEFAAIRDRLWSGSNITRVGKGRVIVATNAEEALSLAGIAPDFSFTGGKVGAEIPFLHRRLVDGDSYFLSNRKDRSETIEAHFRITGKIPELWYPETGTSKPVSYRSEDGKTIVPLTLAADEAVHVVFRKRAAKPSLAIKEPVDVEAGRVEGPWHVAFQTNRGAPAAATFAKLSPLNEHKEPGIKYFSGIATYTNGFTTPKDWKQGQPLWLDLGEAKEIAEVRVNGKLAGHAWHAPYRVDISQVAKPGRNALEIRVANLWVNRMIGDRQPGGTKITWVASPGYLPNAPLRRSGLIGPVTLQLSR